MTALILTALIILSALLHVRAEYVGPVSQIYLFKPLTTVLIIFLAISARQIVSRRYQRLIVIGLLFSLGGDVFLMLPGDYFVPGLLSFLIAHLFYIAAFSLGTRWRLSWSIIPFILIGAVIYAILFPGLGSMMVPVLLYVIVILAMAWRAWERWAHSGDTNSLFALIGALLFVTSDAFLAFNRFHTTFDASRALVLFTYFCAQWFIAMSVRAVPQEALRPSRA